MANFVAAIDEAERLTEQIKLEKAQFDQSCGSIDVQWAELERLAGFPAGIVEIKGPDRADMVTQSHQ